VLKLNLQSNNGGIMSKLHPLGSYVVARPDNVQKKTASGIFLPDNAAEKPKTVTVEAVGSDVKNIKVGDKIIVKSYSTTDFKYENEEYLIVKDEDILAKVK
jgi:chaperonin GroES